MGNSLSSIIIIKLYIKTPECAIKDEGEKQQKEFGMIL